MSPDLTFRMNKIENNTDPVNAAGVRATYANERYGLHELNTFDIWLTDSDKPTPLVIYIHGGGFVGGDKSKYHSSEDLVRFLDAGVSVATINYRFLNEAPYGILGCMNDSKRCLQYIRYHSEKYNVDKTRIACSGGSAGAGTALWLAFSDDMADSLNNDPVLRESTKILCAGAFATQSTYDICQWDDIIGLPKEKSPEEIITIGRAFGLKYATRDEIYNLTTLRANLDFLGKMEKDDPPFFVYNEQAAGIPTTTDELNHHPFHAKALKEKAEKVGVEAIVYAPEIGIIDPSGKDLVEFFLEKFWN